ncbi:hypothetical protein [Nocardioides ferulae]|uniref:hypothetical protein n=1 Tax=Nocardioides ferulae TaxID=2340821 RepID=UPI000EADDA97|nr:hypothetical protein [Nocardioides ferulae]
MSGRVVLHLGAMKTGTSFVQDVLGQHPEQLAAAGVEFLGGFGKQTRAVLDGLRRTGTEDALQRWRRLISGAPDDRTAVVSMEFLSFASPRQVAGFLEPLRGREVQVVLTVRDQLRVLPAQWQSYTRNFGTSSFADYLREVREPRPRKPVGRAYRTYHRAQDIVEIVDRWVGRPEVARFDVVTVPPPGAPREELWERFCRAIEVTVPGIGLDAVHDNSSLGYASCDALRRVNVHLQDVAPGRYRKVIRPVARETLAQLRNDESRPVLDQAAADYARARNREVREVLGQRGVGLVGDLGDLPVDAPAEALSAEVVAPPAEEVLRAARAVWQHAARTARVADTTLSAPQRLDEIVSDAARMLRGLAEGDR